VVKTTHGRGALIAPVGFQLPMRRRSGTGGGRAARCPARDLCHLSGG
jgi:hypothetical protein